MDIIDQLALTLGASWASGLNAYAAIAILGYFGLTGALDLPDSLQILSDPLVLGAAALMYCVEFIADKIPGVDSGWDALHTFIRIPIGALLAAGGASGLDLGMAGELAAALLGGGLAATTHSMKAGSRLMINTSPEPLSNWTASVSEDIAVVAGLWTALNHPLVFLIALALFILAMFWLLPMLWRALRAIGGRIGRVFGRTTGSAPRSSG